MSVITYRKDTLVLEITVYEDGAVKDITGATITAAARQKGEGYSDNVDGTTNITNGTGGVFQATWAAGDIDEQGPWTAETRMTISGETQTVWQGVLKVRDIISAQ